MCGVGGKVPHSYLHNSNNTKLSWILDSKQWISPERKQNICLFLAFLALSGVLKSEFTIFLIDSEFVP